MQRPSVLGVIVLFVVVLPARAQVSTSATWTYSSSSVNSCPLPKECSAWIEFRTSHPGPYQSFVVSNGKDESFIIISEPPPSLSRRQLDEALRALFSDSSLQTSRFKITSDPPPSLLRKQLDEASGSLFSDDSLQISRFHWPTGVDGWLEDVVIRVRPTGVETEQVTSGIGFATWQASSWIVARLRLLHQLFFGTADGLWVDRLGDAPTKSPIPDFNVGVSDLAEWTSRDESWQSVRGDEVKKTHQLYADDTPGVYYSGTGLVALVAPNSSHLSELAPHFRRFAVASDLLIGASGLRRGGMVLFARQRQLDFTTLPPLRFESLATFAKAPAEHLAQSYERQRIFAGKLLGGEFAGWDWAPILLSSQLEDAESGTLLNLADQILKSWSEHGTVGYYAFPYPNPASYPFGVETASEYFGRKYLTTSLVFNWNTAGVATITTVNGADLLTGDRTGALAILYRPSDSLNQAVTGRRVDASAMQRDADERAKYARNYFAAIGDPILVRVVQHVMLFQAVQSFLKVSDAKVPQKSSRSDLVAGVLTERASAWIKQINDGGPGVDPALRAALQDFTSSSKMTMEQLARFIAYPQAIESEYQQVYQRYHTAFINYKYAEDHLPEEMQHAHEIFLNTCSSVGGKYEALGDHGECRWPRTMGGSAELVFATYGAYSKAVEKMQADYESSVATLKGQLAELNALDETFARAGQFSKRLSKASNNVDHDDVLQAVLQAAGRQVTSSSIRTPSVVLSKNAAEADFVGGHNIDLVPQRQVVAPKFTTETVLDHETKTILGQKPTIKVVLKPADLGPARSAKEALGLRRSGNLLDELRHAAMKAEQTATTAWTEIEVKAKSCACDALVINGEDGNIYFFRNAPPPARQVIYGKSGIIDMIAGPPASKNVRFEGFQESTVDNIARTTALVRGGDLSESEGTLQALADFFKPAERRAGKVSYTLEREISGQPEQLTLSQDAGATISPEERLSWHTSMITDASPTRWIGLFGEEGRLAPSSSDALIVRFQSAQGTQSRWLGIRVQTTTPRRPGVIAKLRNIVEGWRNAQPAAPRRFDESLFSLRAAIRKQLNPVDLEFYYNNNRGKIRAAENLSHRMCNHQGCRV